MEYTSIFAGKGGQQYAIVIITSGGDGGTRTVTPGETPFEVQMSENDNIYTPTRLSTATVNLIQDNGKDLMLDMYSGEAQGTKVILYRADSSGSHIYMDSSTEVKASVVWIGYATPVTYDNDYKGQRDTISLECMDGLTSLKYIKYSRWGKITSFQRIIGEIIALCDCYDNIYISAATHLPGETEPITERLFISEQNFFKSKDDRTQTDNDVAWTCYDVLQEICRFLNLFVIAWGSDVYFIDLDAVRQGVNTYYKYNYNDVFTTSEKVSLSDNITVSSKLYRSAGGTLSLDEVYRNVKIKDNFYTFSSVIPDIFDLAENITKDTDSDKSSRKTIDEKGMGAIILSSLQTYGETKKNMEVLFIFPSNYVYAAFLKYYKSPNFKTHRYVWNGSALTEKNLDTLNYTDTQGTYGAYLLRTYTLKIAGKFFFDPWYKALTSGNYTTQEIIQAVLDHEGSGSITLEDRVMLCNPSPHHISNGSLASYPYLETEVTEGLALAGGKNTYIVISGSYRYQKYDEPFMSNGEEALGHGRYAADIEDCHLVAKLKWGDLYWSGDQTKGSKGWVSSECTFSIPYAKYGDNTRADNLMWKDVEIANNVRWDSGIDESGYMIPLPDNTLVSGIPHFTLYKPYDPNYHSSKSGDNEGQYYKHNQVFLKDFKIQLVKSDPSREDDADTDTTYTNIIDADNVSDMDDEEFRITTNDNKNPSFSDVAVKTDAGYVWLGDTINDATQTAEKEWSVVDDDSNVSTTGQMRQEQHRVFRYVNQYSSPAAKITFTSVNVVKPWSLITEPYIGKKFVVDAQQINYKEDTSVITMREMQ